MSLIQVPSNEQDLVSFSVVCRPSSGASLTELKTRLNLASVRDFAPDQQTKAQVALRLKELGFTVFETNSSPVVSARGTLKQFQSTFKAKLTKVRHSEKAQKHKQGFFCMEKESFANPSDVQGALLVIPAEQPRPCAAALMPPASEDFHLRHPVDIAMLTRAALVHRQVLPSGLRATGAGVRVAIIDEGFYPHTFYDRNGFFIQAERAADVVDPATDDPAGHGTRQTINIFSCAPDATVIGIKLGDDPVLAFDRAVTLSAKVITCSWGFEVGGQATLADQYLPLRLTLLSLLSSGVSLVFSGGNHSDVQFPAMMPEVVAVGGVSALRNGIIEAWEGTSSYVSPIFPARSVPDLCGLSSRMAMPTSPESNSDNSTWSIGEGETSAAAPQIAGVIALLLQKDPTLTPERIKTVLLDSAKDVKRGEAADNEAAAVGKDEATGAGFVDAFAAWQSV